MDRTLTASSSSKGKEGGKDGGDKANVRKADFAAYWSLKIKELFANRRKFIEEAERRGMPTPEMVKKLDMRADKMQAELDILELESSKLEAIRREENRVKNQESAAQAEVMLSSNAFFKDERQPLSPEEENLLAEKDIDRARSSLRAASIYGLAMNLHRARELIKSILLSPLHLLSSISKRWNDMFNSQSYENFLMAEGERIWYWRNRSENERWFWEVILIERFVIPLVCAVAYEYLVPNNFIWAVIVPLSLIYLQSNRLPGITNIEFWLIGYFGFYQKCLPGLISSLRSTALGV